MDFFGLKKPGFVFVEFTHVTAPKWAYDENTLGFDNYLKVFSAYIKASN